MVIVDWSKDEVSRPYASDRQEEDPVSKVLTCQRWDAQIARPTSLLTIDAHQSGQTGPTHAEYQQQISSDDSRARKNSDKKKKERKT